MRFAQHIDYSLLKKGFVESTRDRIPEGLGQYGQAWEASAEYFFDLFLQYLSNQGLEIRFKTEIDL